MDHRRTMRLYFLLVASVMADLALCVATDAQAGPDSRETPVPSIKTSMGTMPGVNDLAIRKELPDVMVMNDGTKVTTLDQWKRRREEMKRILEYYAIGLMPPPPGNVKGREIQSQMVLDGTVKYRLVHLTFGPDEKLDLNIGIFTPTNAPGPFPAVIMPSGTPPGASPLPMLAHPPGQGHGVDALLPLEPATSTATNVPGSGTSASTNTAVRSANPSGRRGRGPATAETVAEENRQLFRRGYAYVMFNNNDCAEDTTLRNADGSWAFRTTRFYPAYPNYDWGILAGWAWGVSRIVDYLETDPSIDKAKLIISGVSRTGKSAVVAAAFDDRLAMGAPCVTGGGGVGAYRFSGAGRGSKEGLGEMMKKYPNWFSPHLHEFWGQTDKLPFDENWFLALVAPRPFIALEGLSDPVSLANAVKQSWLGAQPAYALFGATDRLGVNYAHHGHAFTEEDRTAMLDFADKYLRGMKLDRRFDQFPTEAELQAASRPPEK
ncbi:MAG TPA: alpha/beta hydrolase family protein [Verrucomicrobiae bacterium]|nr:alpha/beta hydrolase family protein [Verrucomicrobiae bacterium]